MKTPVNRFKQAIQNKQVQYGLWTSLASAYSTEICAGAGFDWLLLDGEHAPNDLQSILMQLQIVAAYPDTHPIVRVPVGHGHAGTTLIKQYMDVGAATILVPMVDTAEQAKALVEAMRYPPHGIRGMGGARATRNTPKRPTNKCVCWCKPKPPPPCKTSTPLQRLKAWMACSLARPICRPPWAMWATKPTPR